jgi:hypothetical protein
MSAFLGGFAKTVLGNRQNRAKLELASKLEADLLERRQVFEQIQNDNRMMARRDENAMESEWRNRQAERDQADKLAERKLRKLDMDNSIRLREKEIGISAINAQENRLMRKEAQEQNSLYRRAQIARDEERDNRSLYKDLITAADAIEDDADVKRTAIRIQASSLPYAERIKDLKDLLEGYALKKQEGAL